jgi:hypothetical protein
LDLARNLWGDVTFEMDEDLLEGLAADVELSVAGIRKANLVVLGTRGMGTYYGQSCFYSICCESRKPAPCAKIGGSGDFRKKAYY